MVRGLFVLGPLFLCLCAPLASVGTIGCGKTHTGAVVRTDPRERRPPVVPAPAWDPPTEANGFTPLPLVLHHP
jgi:hypothetical protein